MFERIRITGRLNFIDKQYLLVKWHRITKSKGTLGISRRSGVPVAHVRSTVFMEAPFFSSMAASSIAKDGTIRLPFGSRRTSPISASDVARVISTILEDPTGHQGKVYELTGPRSEDMIEMAKEYATSLSRPVKYVDTPYDKWLKEELLPLNLPQYLFDHVSTMASTRKIATIG
jgi:NAD(P)H dehydrogenase (quinone)